MFLVLYVLNLPPPKVIYINFIKFVQEEFLNNLRPISIYVCEPPPPQVHNKICPKVVHEVFLNNLELICIFVCIEPPPPPHPLPVIYKNVPKCSIAI